MADSSGGFPARNFSPGRAILPSDDLIVSRFSSLSGCLNPKIKAFRPRFISPLPGAFYSSGSPGSEPWRPAFHLQPLRQHFATFVYALSCGAREQQYRRFELQAYLLEGGRLLG